jgi:VWFA-related protein
MPISILRSCVRTAAVAAGALTGGTALAQTLPAGGGPVFSAGADLVILSATAVDGKGRPVTDLKPGELRVFDEGRPQPLEHFTRADDLQARLLLLVDASGSMDSELQTTSTQMAAIQLLGALSPEDRVGLAGFDKDYFALVQWTGNFDEVRQALTELESFGTTALHDALEKAAEDIAGQGEGQRAIVVITDGNDTASERTPDEVIARSRALDVPIYAISVLSPLDDPGSPLYTGRERPTKAAEGVALLKRYATLSGGQAFAVSDFRSLRAAALEIVQELKNQYRLGYRPPNEPAGFRRVEIRSTRKGVVVRTRQGYVAGH